MFLFSFYTLHDIEWAKRSHKSVRPYDTSFLQCHSRTSPPISGESLSNMVNYLSEIKVAYGTI